MLLILPTWKGWKTESTPSARGMESGRSCLRDGDRTTSTTQTDRPYAELLFAETPSLPLRHTRHPQNVTGVAARTSTVDIRVVPLTKS
jgi:hypothetical protein